MQANPRLGLSVEYETQILNADGTIAKRNPAKRNLILNAGLDLVATVALAGLTTSCAIGTGTKPVKRDSGTITIELDSNSATASAGFFEAADVNRLLKLDSGEECRIVAYNSPTSVDTDRTTGPTITDEATIWYVNETTHQTETKRTNAYATATGDCGTTFNAGTITHKRTFLFTAESAPVTYREIGWSNSNTAGATLFGRDLLPGSGDSLATGQQYKVIVRLNITLTPNTPASFADVGNNGFDTTGQGAWQYLGDIQSTGVSDQHPFSNVTNTGATNTPAESAEPAGTNSRLAHEDAALLSNTSASAGPNVSNIDGALTNGAYSTGTFTRTKSRTVAVGNWNGSIRGFTIVGGKTASAANRRAFHHRFDAAQTKLNTHTLTVTFRYTWNRILVN